MKIYMVESVVWDTYENVCCFLSRETAERYCNSNFIKVEGGDGWRSHVDGACITIGEYTVDETS